MADISITAASVKLISGPTESVLAGATVTAGQVAYKEAATSKVKLADNDNATPEIRAVYGILLGGAADGQPVAVAKNGAVIDIGSGLTAGVDYYLSGTAGAFCVRTDVTTGHDPVRIGMALTAGHLQLDFNDPGVTL